jgi:hypothetical protein
MMKVPIHLEDIRITNIFAPKNRALKTTGKKSNTNR